jgi:hypothetical protein
VKYLEDRVWQNPGLTACTDPEIPVTILPEWPDKSIQRLRTLDFWVVLKYIPVPPFDHEGAVKSDNI